MKTRIMSGIFLLAIIAGCSTMLVQSDYDREINFSTFHTFDWTAQSVNTDSKADKPITLFERRLKKAVDKELSANGFQKQSVENPDFLIAYSINVKDKVNAFYGGYGYGYGFFGYGGYGLGGYGHHHGYWGYGHHYGYGGYGNHYGYGGYGHHRFGYRSRYYNVGGLNAELTLVLDFIDPETNNVIWSGLYKDETDESGIIVMTEDEITKAVKKILKEFPPNQMTITDRSFSNTEAELVSITTLERNRPNN